MMLVETGLPIKLRPALQTDRNFIKSCWMKSFMETPQGRSMKPSIYKKFQGKLVEDLLNKSIVMILCNEEVEDEIYTFISYRKPNGVMIIDYIYTKHPYRKMGLAKLLINKIIESTEENDSVFYTHNRWKNDIPRAINGVDFIYNPYLLNMNI